MGIVSSIRHHITSQQVSAISPHRHLAPLTAACTAGITRPVPDKYAFHETDRQTNEQTTTELALLADLWRTVYPQCRLWTVDWSAVSCRSSAGPGKVHVGQAYVTTYRCRSLASVWRSATSCSRLRTNSFLAAFSSLLSASMTSRLPWHAQWHVADVTSGDAVPMTRSEVGLAGNESRVGLSFPRWKPVKYNRTPFVLEKFLCILVRPYLTATPGTTIIMPVIRQSNSHPARSGCGFRCLCYSMQNVPAVYLHARHTVQQNEICVVCNCYLVCYSQPMIYWSQVRCPARWVLMKMLRRYHHHPQHQHQQQLCRCF